MKHTSKLTLIMVTMMFLTLSLIPNLIYGQNAVFSNCKLEHNVKGEDGKKMLVYHCTIDFTNMKGHDIRIQMEVESPKGTEHTYTDGDTGGEGLLHYPVWDVETYENDADNFSFKDYTISIYNSNLYPKPGKHTYYVRLRAYDTETYEEIGDSEYIKFSMTGK